MTEPPDSRTLSPADLLDMILQLRAEVTGLRAENAALKDEIRRLKGLPPRPTLKPRGMEQSSKRSAPAATGPKRRGSSRAIVTEERRLCYEPPPGSRFLERTSFVVQDLTIGVRVVRYQRPDIPLHTNGSENDIRSVVTRPKISGGTHSDQGRAARDTMLSMMKTCNKLGVSFWDYLGDRLGIPGTKILPLPVLIAAR